LNNGTNGHSTNSHKGATLGDGADRGEQVAIDRRLGDVPRCARGQRRAQIRGVLVHGQDQHPRLRACLPEAFQDLEAATSRHGEVERQHIRVGRAGLAQGFMPIGGFAHDFHVRLGVDEHPESGPDDGMVINDQDANLRHGSPP
jgi:hypothetical protein